MPKQKLNQQINRICSMLVLVFQLLVTVSPAKLANTNSGANSGTSGQRFAMEPQDQTAIVGSRVTLPCRVIGKNGWLQWTKDDFGLGTHRNLSGFERYSMVGSDEEGDYSLDIYPVMLDDDAKYQCQVGPSPTGIPGIRSRFATLTVLVPPEPPKIIQGDFLVTTEDREIELECVSVGGKPAAEITWIDGLGNVLTTGIDYMKEPLADSRRFTAKSILKLTPKKEHHNTTFLCQAQNTADRTYRSAKLKLEVKFAPKVTVSVQCNGNALTCGRIPEGADVTLSCHSDANPIEVKRNWYINEELVSGDYTTEMVIHNVTRKYHDAIVKCEVHNVVGKSEESETLDISYGPAFKTYPKSVEADIDTSVSLQCDVNGNPTPDILWIHEPSERIVGTSSNLTVVVTHETAGAYKCKASVMGFAEISAEASIYLKGPPTITSPRQQFGIIGDNARIECVAFSVPKARHVSWTFNGREINTNTDQDYSILEDPLPEGIKSTLIIRESQSKHFGRYNCTVVNDHGNFVLEIDLMAQKTYPSLMIIFGAMLSIAVLMLFIMLFAFCFKKGKKKLPPADVIPEQHKTDKNCKESDRSSNLSDVKVDIRSGSHDYLETCSGTDSVATRIAVTALGSINSSSGGNGGSVPLAGPVKIPDHYRYSGEYTDTLGQLQPKSGQNNNGYVPYVDYSRGDYSPPPHTLANRTNTANSLNNMSHMNGQIPSGNLSLTRNRHDLRQDNGLPTGSSNSLQNGLLCQPLLQNGLSTIDPRYSAAYCNPYLRNSSASLPPLPPSTANPGATPAPPPYNSNRNIQSSIQQPPVSSPSGQFILPANGNLKKGTLATHV
ncbi:irregular chiasm C-roughest protein isoform X1 [Bradysia coprophila]|uniref:irregular chiasm C-roughest protein isoform X1 n=1 Tax=Bradysia coprophila TaxID=38358 RepID=UPI00187DA762|nr:irregular chiasm C-roughest protein isoform X1 [Bradysia coprophila]